jgi:hypothetical protein
MADAPLPPQLQALLFQHRLALRRERMAPREAANVTSQVFDAPPVPVEPPMPSLAKKPIGLEPDYKGSEIQAKYDIEGMQQRGATEREGMQQKGAMDRAKMGALQEIETLRFKALAKKAGGGHAGKWDAYLKIAAEEAKAPQGSAEREALGGVKRAIYQGLPGVYRNRAEASGIGFGTQAKGPAGSDIKLTAETQKEANAQVGREKVARIGTEGRMTTAEMADKRARDIAASRVATGEKPQDTMVRQAMGGKDVRAEEAERLRAGGTKVKVDVDDDTQQVKLPDGTVLSFDEARKRGIQF